MTLALWTKFRRKSSIVDAIQWFPNGPQVEGVTREIPPVQMKVSGSVDNLSECGYLPPYPLTGYPVAGTGVLVRPGDWLVRSGVVTRCIPAEQFGALYELDAPAPAAASAMTPPQSAEASEANGDGEMTRLAPQYNRDALLSITLRMASLIGGLEAARDAFTRLLLMNHVNMVRTVARAALTEIQNTLRDALSEPAVQPTSLAPTLPAPESEAAPTLAASPDAK